MHLSRFILILFIFVTMLVGCEKSNEERQAIAIQKEKRISAITEALVKEAVDPLQLQGELSETFTLNSKYTDLQREKFLPKVIGRVIQWTLPVYEISLSDGIYTIRTTTDSNELGVLVYILSRSPKDVELLETLKTGDFITFKGRISEIKLRLMIVITPAIIIHNIVDAGSRSVDINSETESTQDVNLDSGNVDVKKDSEPEIVDEDKKLENESIEEDTENTSKESSETTSPSAVREGLNNSTPNVEISQETPKDF